MIKNYFIDIFNSRYILTSMVRLDIKNQYRNSMLGLLWNFLSPLMMCLVIGIVYSVLFQFKLKDFIPFLFSGLTPWFFLMESASGGCISFLRAEGYIKQTNVPINIYPVRLVLVSFVNCIFSVFAYFLVCLVFGIEVFSVYNLLIIPNLLILLIFAISLSTINGFIHTYFRDFAPINNIFMQAMFYVTPIIYPAERILETDFGWIVAYNPFYYFIGLIRSSMLGKPVDSFTFYVVTILLSLLLFFLVTYLNKRIGRQIVHKL